MHVCNLFLYVSIMQAVLHGTKLDMHVQFMQYDGHFNTILWFKSTSVHELYFQVSFTIVPDLLPTIYGQQ